MDLKLTTSDMQILSFSFGGDDQRIQENVDAACRAGLLVTKLV